MKATPLIVGFAFTVLTSQIIAGQSPSSDAVVKSPATDYDAPLESFDTLEDPTMFSSRASLGYEGLQKHQGDFRNKFILSGAYAFKVENAKDTATSAELPLVSQNYGDNGTGLGDFKIGAGHVFKPYGTFRWGAGLETLFPTATSDEIGDGVIKLTPVFGWQARILKNLQFGGRLKYNYSVYEEQGRSRVNSIEFNPQLLAEWPHSIYTFAAWNSEWSLLSGGQYTGKFETQIGKAFGEHNQWVAFIGAEFPWINGGSDICTIKTGITYLFK